MIASFLFHVPGVPAPKGSFVGVWSSTSQRVVFKNSSRKTKPFQLLIAEYAHVACLQARAPRRYGGRVELSMDFTVPKPVKWTHPHEAKPDLDKLERTVLDGLTGVIYIDDCQVARNGPNEKFFLSAEHPILGVVIKVVMI